MDIVPDVIALLGLAGIAYLAVKFGQLLREDLRRWRAYRSPTLCASARARRGDLNQVALTDADLDHFEHRLRKEVDGRCARLPAHGGDSTAKYLL